MTPSLWTRVAIRAMQSSVTTLDRKIAKGEIGEVHADHAARKVNLLAVMAATSPVSLTSAIAAPQQVTTRKMMVTTGVSAGEKKSVLAHESTNLVSPASTAPTKDKATNETKTTAIVRGTTTSRKAGDNAFATRMMVHTTKKRFGFLVCRSHWSLNSISCNCNQNTSPITRKNTTTTNSFTKSSTRRTSCLRTSTAAGSEKSTTPPIAI